MNYAQYFGSGGLNLKMFQNNDWNGESHYILNINGSEL